MKTVCIYNVGVGNTELLATKINIWQKQGLKIRMICPSFVVGDFSKLVKDIEYIAIPYCHIQPNKIKLIFELVKRSVITCLFIPNIIKDNPTIYSISSVLDALLIPYLIKLLMPEIRWVALFENQIYLQRPGSLLIRCLSYFFYQISLLLLKKTDIIFVITDELKSILTHKGWSNERLVITGNAIDVFQITRAIQNNKYKFDALFLGRIDEQKGVFDLIRAGKKIVSIFPKFTLRIAGSGDEITENKIRQHIKDCCLEKNVRLLGYVTGSKKYQLLANTRIFLFPSYSESFGVALLEAVCSGKKAITYDLPAYHKIYLHQEIQSVPLGNWTCFADKVIETLKSNSFINKAGLRLLKSNIYTYDNIALTELMYFFA